MTTTAIGTLRPSKIRRWEPWGVEETGVETPSGNIRWLDYSDTRSGGIGRQEVNPACWHDWKLYIDIKGDAVLVEAEPPMAVTGPSSAERVFGPVVLNSPVSLTGTAVMSLENVIALDQEWLGPADAAVALLDELRERLFSYRCLQENWDGYGGMPTTHEAAKLAEKILANTIRLAFKLGIRPSLGPLADGGMDIEWFSPTGHELLVEIPPEGGQMNYVVSKRITLGSFEDRSGRLENPEEVAALIRELV